MPNKRDVAAFLSTAREQFHRHRTEENDIREDARKDSIALGGDTWSVKDRTDREDVGRPVLTFPKLHAHVQQVSNEARQNKPQIKFAPVDDGADKETAAVLEGLARHIQYSSDADVAYEIALEHAAAGGVG